MGDQPYDGHPPQSHKWIFIWWKECLMRARYGQTTDRNPPDRKSSYHTKDGHPLGSVQGVAVCGFTIPSPNCTILTWYEDLFVWLRITKRVCVLENVDFHHKRVCELGKVDVHHKRVCVLEKVDVHLKRVRSRSACWRTEGTSRRWRWWTNPSSQPKARAELELNR